VVERDQGGGGVGAAAAQTAPHGQVLVDADERAPTGAGRLLQQTGGAYRQIGLRRHADDFAMAGDRAIVAHFEP
jgi:hypothetical protein